MRDRTVDIRERPEPQPSAFLVVAVAYGVGAVVLYKRRTSETAPALEPVDGNDY